MADDLQDRLQKTEVADGVDTSGLGIKLTYTVPAGKTATVTFCSIARTGGGTFQLEVVRASATYSLGAAFASDLREALDVQLEAGDAFSVRCTSAGTSADIWLGIVEKSK